MESRRTSTQVHGLNDGDGPDLLAAAESLRWTRPDLTAELADHVLGAAAAAGDRHLWLAAAGWAVHARSATGDGRVVASEALDELAQWDDFPLDSPVARRLCVELAVLAVAAGEVAAARALSSPAAAADVAPAIRADAYCVLARCLVEDRPAEAVNALRRAESACSEIEGPHGGVGSAGVALVAAFFERRSGRPLAAAEHAAEGLARLDGDRNASHVPTSSGHLAAALSAEWISALIDAGRLDDAAEGCAPLESLLADRTRPSRQVSLLRLTVARILATQPDSDAVIDALEDAARGAAQSDAPDLEAVCLSTLSALHESAGRSNDARDAAGLGAAAQRRDQDRATRFVAALRDVVRSGSRTGRLFHADGEPAVDLFTGRGSTAGALSGARGVNGRTSADGGHDDADQTTRPRDADPWDPPAGAAGRTTRPDADPGDRWAPVRDGDTYRDSEGAGRSDRPRRSLPGRAQRTADPVGLDDRAASSDRGGVRGGDLDVRDGAAARAGGDRAGSEGRSGADDAGHDLPAVLWSGRSGEPAAITPWLAGATVGATPRSRRPPAPDVPADTPRRGWVQDAESPIADMLARDLTSGLVGGGNRRAARPFAERSEHGRQADPSRQSGRRPERLPNDRSDRVREDASEGLANRDPFDGGPRERRSGRTTDPHRVDDVPRAARYGAIEANVEPGSWLENALGELDRALGHTTPGPAGSQPSVDPRRHGPEAEGCVVVVDIARDGRRFAGPRAGAVVRAVTDRLSDRLPPGARIRQEESDALSVVLPGWGRAPATEWMHRTMPGLLEGVALADDLPGTQLRAAVHDVDGPVGAQILQRIDLAKARRAHSDATMSLTSVTRRTGAVPDAAIPDAVTFRSGASRGAISRAGTPRGATSGASGRYDSALSRVSTSTTVPFGSASPIPAPSRSEPSGGESWRSAPSDSAQSREAQSREAQPRDALSGAAPWGDELSRSGPPRDDPSRNALSRDAPSRNAPLWYEPRADEPVADESRRDESRRDESHRDELRRPEPLWDELRRPEPLWDEPSTASTTGEPSATASPRAELSRTWSWGSASSTAAASAAGSGDRPDETSGGRHGSAGRAPFRIDGQRVEPGSGGRRHRRAKDEPSDSGSFTDAVSSGARPGRSLGASSPAEVESRSRATHGPSAAALPDGAASRGGSLDGPTPRGGTPLGSALDGVTPRGASSNGPMSNEEWSRSEPASRESSTDERGTPPGRPGATDGLGLADLLAGALAAYRGI